MDRLLEIGGLLVLVIFGLALWQKYTAQTLSLTQAGVNANRGNAWTSLAFNGGMLAENDLQQWFNNSTN